MNNTHPGKVLRRRGWLYHSLWGRRLGGRVFSFRDAYKTLRLHVRSQLGRSAGLELDRHTDLIFQFYEKMRDDPRIKPEAVLQEPGGAICYPIILKFARALDQNRDGNEGEAVRPAAQLLGRRLGKGRYKILYRLGVGGMGEVYAASRIRASENEDFVAVKTLKPLFPSGTEMDSQHIKVMVRRLRHEALSLDQVENYKHVSKFIEDGYDSEIKLIYIVTEFIDGRSLNELAFHRFRDPLPPSEVLWLIRETCKGLVAIHHAPEPSTTPNGSSSALLVAGKRGMLLHRDVKPSNILFDRVTRVKLIDLGLAGASGAMSIVGGTRGFSDPDQFRPGIDLDERVDIYALGKTFYSLFCRDPSPPESELPALTNSVWNGLPPAYVDVILRATAPDRTKRYQNAEAFLAALEALGPASEPNECLNRLRQLLAEEDREVNIWVGQDLARRRTPKRPWTVALGILAVLVLVMGAAFLMLLSGRFGKEPPPPGGEILVRKLDVVHWAKAKGGEERKGNLGEKSFVTCPHDAVTISAELSEPAYCYLIAFSPDGKVRVCFPDNEDTPPTKTDRPRYPLSGDDSFGLEEGTGLQAFYLVASRQELPNYADWRKALQAPPDWRSLRVPDKAVWKFNGVDTFEFTADRPFEPTGNATARELGRKLRRDDRVMAELNRWLRGDPRIETSAGIGFAVSPP